jgi:hypothetical protein
MVRKLQQTPLQTLLLKRHPEVMLPNSPLRQLLLQLLHKRLRKRPPPMPPPLPQEKWY